MKFIRRKLLLAGTMSLLLLTGCISKEEKAAELIRTELSKTLYDFDSYQPIETKVTVAKASAFNDSACWDKAGVLAVGLEKFLDKIKDAKNAAEHATIWGRPTYYSSSYSDRQYYKYRNEIMEAISEANTYAILCNMIADSLNHMIQAIDTSAIVGWEVRHDFRCKTKGGSSEIAHYRYVIDKKFKKVVLHEDTESEHYKRQREAIEMVENGWEEIKTLE